MRTTLAAALRRPPSIATLMLLAGLPALTAAWLVASPGVIVSRSSTSDFLFNLAGAWRIYTGQTPHVDFHHPIGQLYFRLTAVGFHVVGPIPKAFVVGELIMLAFVFAAAVLASLRRLPLVAAVTFVLVTALPIVTPITTGGTLTTFTYAMTYNRYGWSAISVLCLILFAPPRDYAGGAALDVMLGALLLAAMFYIKVTYFIVGVAAVGVALLVCDHIRSSQVGWIAVGLAAVINTAAPYTHPYLQDLWDWALFRRANTSLTVHLEVLLSNAPEYALFGIGLISAVWVWRRGLAPMRVPVAAAFLIAASAFLVAYNTQLRGMPLGIVVGFMLYNAVCENVASGEIEDAGLYLAALLIYPLLVIGAISASLVLYHRAATNQSGLYVVDHTNLRGLAVPSGSQRAGRDVRASEYINTILEAAAQFAGGSEARIQVLDDVNPLPFALGFAAPRGDDVMYWMQSAPDRRTAADMLTDTDYVLVPKAPADRNVTDKALALYSESLAQQFRRRDETPHWILFGRLR